MLLVCQPSLTLGVPVSILNCDTHAIQTIEADRALTGDQMKFLKYAALVALAVIPFVLVKKRKDELSEPGREVDSDEIFDLDLKGE